VAVTGPTPERRVDLRPILAFTGTYMLAASVAAVTTGNREFIFYIVTMLVLIAAVAWVHKRVRLTAGALWGLSLWGLAHMAGGLVPIPTTWPYNPPNAVLYSLWLIPEHLKYDQVVHAYGFGITTYVCWQGLCAVMGAARRSFGVLVLAGAAGMGFGALNEVIEFAAVLLVPNTNVGGYINTGWDLVANLVGVVVAALLIRWRKPAGPPPGSA
jgi:uncharacterized membrane protein YjdF